VQGKRVAAIKSVLFEWSYFMFEVMSVRVRVYQSTIRRKCGLNVIPSRPPLNAPYLATQACESPQLK
jgi:hypothetical protein